MQLTTTAASAALLLCLCASLASADTLQKVLTVQPGDYLCNITNTYNVSFAALLAVNNASVTTIDPDTLQLTSNSPLNIPSVPPQNCCPTFVYAVKAGEYFFELAQRFGLDVATLLADNNRNSSQTQLTCGDQLLIRCLAAQPSCQQVLPASPPPPVPSPPPPPLPVVAPPPPAFPPRVYTFRVSEFTARKVPSFHTDSDWVTVYCLVNGVRSPDSPKTSDELDMHSGQRRTRWFTCNVPVTQPTDNVTVGWTVVNAGHGNWGPIVDDAIDFAANLTKAITTASGPENSIWGDLITSTLGLGKDIFNILNQDCDGVVAADAQTYIGGELDAIIAAGTWNSFNRDYSRSLKDALCGSNSLYNVHFDILPHYTV